MTQRRTRTADKTSYFAAMDVEQILEIERRTEELRALWFSPEATEVYGVLRAKMMRAQINEQLAEIEKAKARYE